MQCYSPVIPPKLTDKLHGTSSEREDTFRDDQAYNFLRTSWNTKEFPNLCSNYPFEDISIPLKILSKRWWHDEHIRKALDILRNLDHPPSPIWNWEWIPPVETIGSTKVADVMHQEMSSAISKVSFLSLVKEARGFSVPDVANVLNGAAYTCHRLMEVQLRGDDSIVKKELQMRSPFGYWIMISAMNPNGLPDASGPLEFLFDPIRKLFEDRDLDLMSMLQRLNIWALRLENILAGNNDDWKGLLLGNFTLLACMNQEPCDIAKMLTDDHLAHFLRLCPDDFRDVEQSSSKYTSRKELDAIWSTLASDVTICISIGFDPKLFGKVAKILLDSCNDFTGMAILQGLANAECTLTNLSEYWPLLNPGDNYTLYRKRWNKHTGQLPFLFPLAREICRSNEHAQEVLISNLFRSIKRTPPLGCEKKRERSCIPLVGIISALWNFNGKDVSVPVRRSVNFTKGESPAEILRTSSLTRPTNRTSEEIPKQEPQVMLAEELTEKPTSRKMEISSEELREKPTHRDLEEICIVVDSDEENGTQDMDLEWQKTKEIRRERERTRQRVENPNPGVKNPNWKANLDQMY